MRRTWVHSTRQPLRLNQLQTSLSFDKWPLLTSFFKVWLASAFSATVLSMLLIVFQLPAASWSAV